MIPKYLKLKDKINEDIRLKKYPLFEKLPTELELSESYGVSRATVRTALSLLEDEGIIEKKWGSGNVVISCADSSKSKTVALILPFKANWFGTIAEDIKAILYRQSLSLAVFETEDSLKKERQILDEILNDSYYGLITLTAKSALPSINLDLYQTLLKRKTPLVFLNSAPYSLANASVVTGDDYTYGYQSARVLINSGFKSLGGSFDFKDSASMTRYMGFADAIRDADLEYIDDAFSFDGYPATKKEDLKTYIDDPSLLYKNLSRPLGCEAAKLLLEIKKDGNQHSATIPYKSII